MRSRIQEIDGLRAIAMTMVIAQHCGLLPFGWIGVWLFYGISGFVITRGFLAEVDNSQSIGFRYGNFMLRRFFRIVPVYLLYIAINMLVLMALNDLTHYSELPYLATFTFNWYMIFGSEAWNAFGHLWTLSVEEQFYVFFPLIALVAPKRTKVPITVCFIILGPIIRYFYTESVASLRDDQEWAAFAVYASSICHFDAFLLGSLISRFEPQLRKQPQISNLAWLIAIMSGTLYVAAFVYINTGLGASGINAFRNVISGILFGQHREVFLYTVINLLVSAVLIHTVLQRPFSRLLSSRVLVLIGSISYGGYLFHLLILSAVKQCLESTVHGLAIVDRILIFVVVYVSTIGISYLSFKAFEIPIANWGRSYLYSKPNSRIEAL
jgi:peptidoglycan/LPS O-acetylase OafA/YrhL